MREFTFQATLLSSIRVKAETQAEAELKLRATLEASEVSLGMWIIAELRRSRLRANWI